MAKKVVKRKKVAGVKRVPAKKAPVKRVASAVGRVTSIGRAKPKTKKAQPPGFAIMHKIASLEKKLKATTGREQKNYVKVLINAEHDKLEALTKKAM